MASIEKLEARAQQSSARKRQRRCRVAEALDEYTRTGREDERQVIEEALLRDRKKMPDNEIRKELQDDGIKVFAESTGPQSVTWHRTRQCICFTEQPDDAEGDED